MYVCDAALIAGTNFSRFVTYCVRQVLILADLCPIVLGRY